MNNVIKLGLKLRIIYDRSKLFFLKRLINSFVESNPVLKPVQDHVIVIVTNNLLLDKQARSLMLYALMQETADPLIIQLLGMHLDAVKYEKRA